MNFYTTILYGLIVLALFLLYVFNRDRRDKKTLLGRYPALAWVLQILLIAGIVLALYVRFVEPNILRTKEQIITLSGLKEPLTVAVIADLHVGTHKKAAWTQKVVKHIQSLHPDLVLIAGDNIANDGTVEDETIHLLPLREIADQYPTYGIMGNHEYGYLAYGYQSNGDKSGVTRARFQELGIPLLVNQLKCIRLKGQELCLFGNDDVYRQQLDFSELKKWNKKSPLIQISHNPDGIIYWPDNLPQPSLEVSGHTHGGQLWLPFLGPLGRVDVRLGPAYYRWLNYYGNTPVFTTVGVGESGGPIRLFTPPEVALLHLTP